MQLVKRQVVSFVLMFMTFSCSDIRFQGNASSTDSAESSGEAIAIKNDNAKADKPEADKKAESDNAVPALGDKETVGKDEDRVQVTDPDLVTPVEPEPVTPVNVVPVVDSPEECSVPVEAADSSTRINLDTIKKTLTLQSLLYDDGAFEFFPVINTEDKFHEFLKYALSAADGKEFNYLDGWCQPFGLYSADDSKFILMISSAGPDKQFSTIDDIVMIWDAFDY